MHRTPSYSLSIGRRGAWVALVTVAALVLTAVPAVGQVDDWAWQNPNMAANPYNNIHNDSWFTDTYPKAGPTAQKGVNVGVISKFAFDDPVSGKPRFVVLGECPAHTYDNEGNLVTVCAGMPNPVTNEFQRSIVTIGPDGKLLAWTSFAEPFTNLRQALTEFGGIGYFYLDDQDRVVLGMPDGHIVTWERQSTSASDVDTWVQARDVNITGRGGAVPPDRGDLYALVPNEDGYLWFTTTGGVVGTIAPESCSSDCIKWLDINDPDGDGVREPQPDGRMQSISESHSVDGNATFQQSDYFMFRFDMRRDGTPVISWQEAYDRGFRKKSGQTSRGSGTSPSFFTIGDRQYVTIFDNAPRPRINVYRAERRLARGEARVLASVAPFGRQLRVSNENSLVVFPGSRPGTRNIYAENNWGNSSFLSTAGLGVTRPGFGGIEVSASGSVRVLPANRQIRVPSVVSKASIDSQAVYTYEKRPAGWYLTALDPDRPRRELWSARVGGGLPKYNNWYAQLSLAPDGRTFYVGATTGVLAIRPTQDPPPPGCSRLLAVEDFRSTVADLGEWTGGPIWHAEYLRASFRGWNTELRALQRQVRGEDRELRQQVRQLRADVLRAYRILRPAGFDVSRLDDSDQARLVQISKRHAALVVALVLLLELRCTDIDINGNFSKDLRIMLYRSYLPTGGFDEVELPRVTLIRDGVETELPTCPKFADNGPWEDLYTESADLATTILRMAASEDFDPPSGPFPFCSWWTLTTVENFDIAAPDANAAYWGMPLLADDDLEVRIDGVYPNNRYMSLALYNGVANPYVYNEVSSTIPDYLIDPTPGSTNPWQEQADPGGDFQVTITADPKDGESNVLPWYQTNPEGDRGTMPEPCGDPGAQNIACPLSNMFMSPPQDDQAGIFSNVDNRYMMTVFDPDKVYLLRGKLPRTPQATSPVPWPDGQYQLRYFSICSIVYVRPFPAVAEDGCAVDYQIPVDGDGFYSIAYSTEAMRPDNATLDNGIAWIKAEPGVRNFLVMRHMLPVDFPQAAQNVPQDAAWTSGYNVMAEYYPVTTIECNKAAFEVSPSKCFVPAPPQQEPDFPGIGPIFD